MKPLLTKHAARFTGLCLLSPNPDGRTFTVKSSFTFTMGGADGDGLTATVLLGEITDLASVPNLGLIGACIMLGGSLCASLLTAWATPLIIAGFLVALASQRFQRLGKHTRAAVLHDHLYCFKSWPRPVCDSVFFAAMRADGVDFVTAAVMYAGVRIGGWKPFYAKREEARARAYSEILKAEG
jgi:hypothetical protein